MCGICGIIEFDEKRDADEHLLKEMCRVIGHRGPDEEGYHIEGNVGLGARRLSIIDLKTGHQPIHNEDKNIWIVSNGEIYNYKELTQELKQLGHQFYTGSDTEVIVHAYEQYGTGCLAKLRGMFAFALWDKEKREVLLARDRLGIKPLHYALSEGRLIFASEIKSILQDKKVSRELNPAALDHFLTFSCVPAPLTIFKGIKKLLPGTFLRCKGSNISENRHWELPYFREVNHFSEKECEERLMQALRESLELHLRSDVPIGVLLSGGVDSSTILALATQITPKLLKSFSVGFKHPTFNELGYAHRVANLYHTDHYEIIVEPGAVEHLLPKMIWHFDEPFGDASAIPMYLLCQLVGKKVKVVLSGEGGDEDFAGYSWYNTSRIRRLYSSLPEGFKRAIFHLTRKFCPAKREGGLIDGVKSLASFDFLPLKERYLWRKACLTEEEKNRLFTREFLKEIGEKSTEKDIVMSPVGNGNTKDLLTFMTYLDTKIFLPDDLLTKADRMSMAHGVETRLPFLDHPLVEFAAFLPPSLKWKGQTSKYILRKTVSPLLPKEVLERKKQGLMPPLSLWLKEDLRDFCVQLLTDPRTLQRGIFKAESVMNMLSIHHGGKANLASKLWNLMVFETWARIYLDNNPL